MHGRDKVELLNEAQAAKQLSVAPRTLQAWRFYGRGPRWVKVSGRCVRYRQIDLEDWVAEHLIGCEPTHAPTDGGQP